MPNRSKYELVSAVLPDRQSVRFSKRQSEVAALITQGQSNKEIGAALNISERTVKFHVSLLMGRAGVTNRIAFGEWWSGKIVSEADLWDRLSPEMQQCVSLFARGWSYQQIAEKMGRSPSWVNKYLAVSYVVLGMKGRALVAYLSCRGRISSEPVPTKDSGGSSRMDLIGNKQVARMLALQ